MELRCDLCSAKLAIAGRGGSYNCKHNICYYCYRRYRPPECITCQIKPTAASGSGTQNHAPHTQANPSPQPVVSPTATLQFQMSANANPQPYVLPSAVSQPYAPPCNTPQTSTTLCSTVQHHTSQETWFRLPAPEESEHQNATQGMDGRSDVDQMLNNIQRREQDSNVGQSGTTGNVSQLRKRFDSGGTTAQGGATGWRNREEDARTSQGSSHTSRQQDTLTGHKEPQGTQSNTPSVSPSSEVQRTQLKRHHIRGPQPYPSSFLIKDPYLTNSRIGEPVPLPLGTTNTFPPPESRHPSPSTSSAADRNTNPTRSSSRTRDSSPSSSSARNPSRSSSRNRNTSSSSSSSSVRQTNPSRSSSRTRDQSPPSLNARGRPRSSSRNRDPSSSHPRGRISSPSPAQHTDHSHSSSSPRDPSHPSSRHSSPSLSPLGSRKSSTPSKATEPSTAPPHSNGPMFSGTHSKGEYANDATSHHAATHEPQLKQPLTPISAEGPTYPRVQRSMTTPTATMTRGRHFEEKEQWRLEKKGLQGELMVQQEKGDDLQHEEPERRQETQKLTGGAMLKEIETLKQVLINLEGKLNHKKEMLDIKDVEWAWLKEEYDQQQREIVALEEKDRKHQEELAKLEELSLAQQNQAQEQIKTLTQETIELKEKMASLGETKDAQEKEASHWKAEYDKQRAAAEEEMRQFKMQECSRLQKDYDRWVLKMTEMQNKVAAKEGEISQYIKKYNNLQNELQRVQEEWIKSKGEASILVMENAQHQEEKVKYEEEVRDLKQKMSAKCKEWEGERNLYTESVTMLGEKVDSLERENSNLKMKEQENQAALRQDKGNITCLISERNSCQEEIKKLKKDKETYKENMAQLRGERDDCQMKLHALENKPLQSPRLQEQINTLLLDIGELRRKEAEQQEEATQLRQAKDNSKEEADQLKRKEETEVTQLRQERDKYKDEAEQLKRRAEMEVTQLRQERDWHKEEAEQLKRRAEMEVTRLRQERDKYKGETEQLKRRAETEVTRLREERDKYKGEAEKLKRRAETVIAQLRQEGDKYKDDAEQIRRKAESELIKISQERDKYKEEVDQLNRRPVDSYQEKTSDLNWTESKKITELQQERDDLNWQVDHFKLRESTLQSTGDRDKHKQEVDNFKSKEATWEKPTIDLTRESDEHKKSAHQLQMVPERGRNRNREDEGGGAMAEAGPRGDTQPNRDLGNIQAPSTHLQPHTSRAAEEDEEVVTQGLPNLGNSCYINSVVQCLYHLPPLRKTLNSNISRLYYQPGTRVARALAEQFVAMQNATERDVCLTTGTLKRILGSYDVSFSGREQQEAHDLFTALVSCLHSDLSQHDGPDTSPSASSLFGGQLETSMVCLETFTPLTHTSEAFTSLSLPVVGSSTQKLKDLLDKHFWEQKMDWDCEHCHFTHKCSHSTHIRRCPPLLVIHFSRVANFSSTWKTKVKFPVAGLSLQGYVARDAPRSPQYQLVGVVCHVGSMASGHYTAYCRYGRGRRSRKWRLCNDSQVWDVEERRALENENAHMLFYVQQGS